MITDTSLFTFNNYEKSLDYHFRARCFKCRVGLNTQGWLMGDNSIGFNDHAYWDNSYKVFNPLNFSTMFITSKGLYLEFGIEQRVEVLDRLAVGQEELVRQLDHGFTLTSHKRIFHLRGISNRVGYERRFGRFGFLGELGSNWSKIYLMKSRSLENEFQGSLNSNVWNTQKDFMVDLDLGLGITYKLKQKVSLKGKLVGRKRLYTTKYFDKKYRTFNEHPSHSQKHQVGIQLGLEYSLLD